jgi:hypothetical protein
MVHVLYYGMGIVLTVAIGAAVGQGFSRELHNPRILPIAIAISIPVGIAVGWAIDNYIAFVQESPYIRF